MGMDCRYCHAQVERSAHAMIPPTQTCMGIYTGTLGFFFTCFLLFIRWVPMIAIAEVKGVLPQADPHDETHAHEGHGEAIEASPEPQPGE